MSKLREQMDKAMIVRGYSKGTRRHYIGCVNQLSNYYHRSPAAITAPEIEAFLLHLIQDRKLTQASVNAYTYAFRFFYDMLEDELSHLPRGQIHKRLPIVLSPEQVQKLLECTENIKYKTIFMVAYGAGLRVGEIISLKVSDIDSARMLIHVRKGKGKKERNALLSEGLLHALRVYWQQIRPAEYLFPTRVRGHDHISAKSVNRMFHQSLDAAELGIRCGIHCLRHSFATHLIEADVDIFRVQRLLGHTSIRTTIKYLHCSSNHFKEVASPLDALLK